MPVSTESPSSRRPWVPFLLLALGVFLAHGLSLRADFYMDDHAHILQSERIQEGLDAPAGYFKSRHLTYALWRGLHLTTGSNAAAYHALNLLLHLGVTLSFLPVARRFLQLHPTLDAATRERIAFWGTLLFAVHPLVSEPVNYASQASMLLLTLFGTWATYFFLRWSESKRTADLALIAMALGLAAHAKEPGIFHAAIPLFFIGTLVLSIAHLRKSISTNRQKRLAALVTGGCVAAVLAGGWVINAVTRISNPERFVHHALTQSRVLFGYLSRLFYPASLSSDHHIPWTTSWSDLPAVLGLIVTACGAVALLYWAIGRRSWIAALIGIALFHLLIRFAYTVDELMVEYRVYPSMPWFGLLLALGLTQLFRMRSASWEKWRPVAFSVLTITAIALSAQRSNTWSHEDRVTLDVLRQYPNNLRAWSIHLRYMGERGQYDDMVALKNLPQDVATALLAPGEENPKRRFTGEKTYNNYLACQYPLIKALVHTGQLDEALRRSDLLLVDVLKKAPTKNHKGVFTVALAKLLCHTARHEPEQVEATIEAIRTHYDDESELRRHLATEAAALPPSLADAGSEPFVD